MGKHAIPGQKWAYSAAQAAKLLTNEENTRYKQGQLDALLAVSRVQQGLVTIEQFQALLEALPHTWDQSYDGAYVVGFEDMYGALCEHLTTVYAPEVKTKTAIEVRNAAGEVTVSIKDGGPVARSHWDLWLDQ